MLFLCLKVSFLGPFTSHVYIFYQHVYDVSVSIYI